MAERLASDIAADLREWTSGDPEFGPLLIEAADKLDGLIACLARAERERDLVLTVNERGAVVLKQLRAEVERMRPVVEAAKAWRARLIGDREYMAMALDVVALDLAAAVDALDSAAGVEPTGEETEANRGA